MNRFNGFGGGGGGPAGGVASVAGALILGFALPVSAFAFFLNGLILLNTSVGEGGGGGGPPGGDDGGVWANALLLNKNNAVQTNKPKLIFLFIIISVDNALKLKALMFTYKKKMVSLKRDSRTEKIAAVSF
ncbi:MAG: hypothetical protein ACTHNW_18650 [Mucilaginibacter sp.]